MAKDVHAVAMAAKRMTTMTPERRSEVARHAVQVRWAKAKAKKAKAGPR